MGGREGGRHRKETRSKVLAEELRKAAGKCRVRLERTHCKLRLRGSFIDLLLRERCEVDALLCMIGKYIYIFFVILR